MRHRFVSADERIRLELAGSLFRNGFDSSVGDLDRETAEPLIDRVWSGRARLEN